MPVSRTLPGGTGFSRKQERDEVRERPLHARRRRLARKDLLSRLGEDPHPDLERLGAQGGENGRPERAGAGVDLRLGQVERVRTFDLPGGDVVADRDADDLAAGPDDEADLRLRDVPGRVRADADRLAGTDRAAAAGVLEEELGPLGVVDERVHVLDGTLLDARIP